MKSQSDDWGDDVRELGRLLEEVEHCSRQVSDWVVQNVTASDVLPSGLPPELANKLFNLQQSTSRAKAAGIEIFDRVSAGPQARYLRGELLSREEFHLLVSRIELPQRAAFPAGDSYYVFRMFHYDDGEGRCYINPELAPLQTGRIAVRIGVPPEELLWNKLSHEQRVFFERYLPSIARRFKRRL